MLIIVMKFLILAFGILALDAEIPPVLSVAAVLSGTILTALNQYFGRKVFTVISSAAYFALCCFEPAFTPLIPLFCFDLLDVNMRAGILAAFVPAAMLIPSGRTADAVSLFLFILLASLLYYICNRLDQLTEENKHIRDNSTELNRMLTEKNKSLIEKQHYEIHLATLKERNRIAREIHDNVGHILSRSILQTGAAQAINKEEDMAGHLNGLKETLSHAMDSIRTSVHDLHDESIDLYETIRQMAVKLNCEVNINYDVVQEFSNNIKYCFLSVLKEAFTNIEKHSDASRVQVSVQEHPSMYQLLIHDNGTKKPSSDKNNGMGLTNMQERVNAFNGVFSITDKNGFRIFISIPKQEAS